MFEPAWYVWTLVFVAVFGFAGSIGAVLHRGGLAAGWTRRRARRLGLLGFAAMVGWMGVNLLLAGSGVYRRSPDSPIPWIALMLLAAIGAMLWAARRPSIAPALDAPGAVTRLTLPHTWRVFGAVFLVVMADGGLPGVFAVPAGVGDVVIGVAAPVVAWQLARGRGRRSAIWFNVFGALDLVMALMLGFLTAPGLFRVIAATPTTEAVSVLPLALIPSMAVPTAIALHVASLHRLRGQIDGRPTQQRSGAAWAAPTRG